MAITLSGIQGKIELATAAAEDGNYAAAVSHAETALAWMAVCPRVKAGGAESEFNPEGLKSLIKTWQGKANEAAASAAVDGGGLGIQFMKLRPGGATD